MTTRTKRERAGRSPQGGARRRGRGGRARLDPAIVEPLEARTLLSGLVGGVEKAPLPDLPPVQLEPIATKPGVPDPGKADPTAVRRRVSPTEVIVATRAPDLSFLTASGPRPEGSERIDLKNTRTIFRLGEVSYMSVALAEGADPLTTVDLLAVLGPVDWAAPNYIYRGEPEFIPNDPLFASQYQHALMQNDLAWDTTLGDPSIVIAVTDDGVDLDHEDLVDNIWTNPGEIPGNGIDDEGNGFVDDVNGWDFAGDDNDPNPDFPDSDIHGTHVAGIAAGRTNNATGISGTAGGATIMPIRFFNYLEFTSENIADAFTYATDNGANIVNTSYNLDGFVNDALVTGAFNYMYDNGVLHFNSAGNNAQLNPPRQVFTQSLLVASTGVGDVVSGFSNFGKGVDIAAPGSDILSTFPGDIYESISGTSMSTPNTAGVAALIWSAHPDWTRDQVAAQLLATADNIDEINPFYAGLVGTGRANSFRGINESIPNPRFRGVTRLPDDGGAIGTIDDFEVDVEFVLDPATVSDDSFELRFAGADGELDTDDDTFVPFVINSGAPYRIGTNTLLYEFDDLADGLYRYTAFADVLADPFGQPLDGDPDGEAAGDDFVRTFVIDASLTPPSHDDFEDARTLIGDVPITDTSTNVDTTGQEGEPDHAGVSNPLNSVWWQWTAPEVGTVSIDTFGSSYDTTLGVYSGEAVDALTFVAANDDAGSLQSFVQFVAESGVTYRIAVDGFSGATGDIALRLDFQAGVPNDDFADAVELIGNFTGDTGSNFGTTGEPGEPDHAGVSDPLNSAWWSYTAQSDGTLTIDTFGSNYDTTLGVYTGDSVDALTEVASNDDSGGTLQSLVSFAATAGTTYRIAVDGFSDRTGDIALNLLLVPANDAFAAAEELFGTFAFDFSANFGATGEAGEPNHAGASNPLASLWWTYTAPSDGTLTVHTLFSGYDTTLGVYTGDSVGALTEVASNDDSGGTLQSLVEFAATAGTTYRIAVDGFSGDEGEIVLVVELIPPPPVNDDFADALELTGLADSDTSNNQGATGEPGEPDHIGLAGTLNSVWWTYTAPEDGLLSIDTFGSNYDTILAAYTGDSVDALTFVAGNDDFGSLQSFIQFAATAGTTYRIVVDGFFGSTGDIALNLALDVRPDLADLTIDDGSGQRSMVRSVTLTFSEPVTIADGAVSVTTATPGVSPFDVIVTPAAGVPSTTFVVTFAGGKLSGGSLEDGRYDLSVDPAGVLDAAGQALTQSVDEAIHRFFGDSDGDADVDAADFRQFRLALLGLSTVDWFDYTGDGDTDADDQAQFRIRQKRARLPLA